MLYEMATLFTAVEALARKLVALRSGTAASGNTTTCVDTARTEVDDFWNNGTYLNLTNSEWGRITDFVNSTGTLTFSATATATDAGDKYAVIHPRYPRDTLIESINAVLQELEYPLEDSTSLDTIANQTEYTLPAGITRQNLRQIWYRQDTSGAVDYEWKLMRNWYVRPKAIGTQETLVLESHVDAGHDLRLVYTAYHPYLDDPGDAISPYIPVARLLPGAALHAVQSRLNYTSGSKHEQALIDRFYRESVVAEAKHLIPLPQFKGRLKSGW